nr:S24 family peptidase [Faecalibaculum rodentium]
MSDRLRKRRLELGLTAAELGDRVGKNKTTIYRYESGEIEKVPYSVMVPLAKALNTTPAYLMGWEDENDETIRELEKDKKITMLSHVRTHKVPLLGTVACGNPIEAIEESGEFIDLSDAIRGDFALKCRGDSMVNARIYDGDIVVCRKQDTVQNGEIAVVLLDNEVTLKRFYWYEDAKVAILRPENPDYKEIHITADDFVNVRVLGKVLTTIRDVK